MPTLRVRFFMGCSSTGAKHTPGRELFAGFFVFYQPSKLALGFSWAMSTGVIVCLYKLQNPLNRATACGALPNFELCG